MFVKKVDSKKKKNIMSETETISAHFKPQMPNVQIQSGRKHINHRRLNQTLHSPLHETSNNPRYKYVTHSHCDEHMKKLSPVVINGPINPQIAVKEYYNLLTRFELSEIMHFPEIYFVGKRHKKIDAIHSDKYNFGFDNKDHTYKIRFGDHLAYRFEVLGTFGSGAFGQVLRCFDHKTKNVVAVKIVLNTAQMHEQGQIEAKLLARLNKNSVQNVVKAYDFFIFRSHICITFELLGQNLYEFIKSNDNQRVHLFLVRKYAKQIFRGLEGIHKIGIIHCDIKPENILLTGQSYNIKIIDFGSGCFNGGQKYEYIQSRYYRSPEVVLGIPYGPPMDIWSAALVVIELLIGRPLFPCQDELELLWMISEVFGFPKIKLVKQGKRRGDFFDLKLQLKVHKKHKFQPTNLQAALDVDDPNLLDLLRKCLKWDPQKRITAEEALKHPWFQTKTKQIIISEKHRLPSMLPDLRNPQKAD